MSLLYRVRLILFNILGLRTLGAMVLAVDDEGRVLLVRQTYDRGRWTLPGGGVKHRESFREAALREAREEAGIVLRANAKVELLGIYFHPTGRWTDHICVFVVKGWDTSYNRSIEIAEVKSFAVDDLPNMPSAVRERIAEWQGTKPVSERW